jgi:hypothetical protein
VTAEETERLVAELEALPEYRGWLFTYEYPGYFCLSHDDVPYCVFFTPDWEGDESLPIEVQTPNGDVAEEHSSCAPLPREGRAGEKILALVRPTLDRLLAPLDEEISHVDAPNRTTV